MIPNSERSDIGNRIFGYNNQPKKRLKDKMNSRKIDLSASAAPSAISYWKIIKYAKSEQKSHVQFTI